MPFYPEKKDILELQFEKPNVNFLVDENADAIKIYNIIKKLDFSAFYKRYSDKGGIAYKPEVLTGIIVLSVLEGVLSTRAIEKKCARDIYYIYITEYRKPDHSTIARFLQRFKKEIHSLIGQVVILGRENKISSFNTIAIDGTKIQSKTSKKHSQKMSGLKQEEEIISREIKKLLNLIHENDKKESRDEKKQRNLESQKKRLEEKKKKIEELEEQLEQRRQTIKDKKDRENHQINKEEPDARMMKDINASGYNVQVSVDTESEMIVSVAAETDRSDNHQFSKQHKASENVLGPDQKRIYLSDGGYYSEESLNYVHENNVNAYINDSREKEVVPGVEELLESNKFVISEYFRYIKKKNEYRCPNGRTLKEQSRGVYKPDSCQGCIVKHLCARTAEVRTIKRSEFNKRKERMRKKIKKSPGIMHQRKAVERVFGNIKWNHGFRRFTRKGIEGALLEMSLFALALDLKKVVISFLNFCSYINSKLAYKNLLLTFYKYLNIDSCQKIKIILFEY